MLVKADAAYVRHAQPVYVDHSEFCVWIVWSHFAQSICKSETSHHDWIISGFSEATQGLLTLSFTLKFDFAK